MPPQQLAFQLTEKSFRRYEVAINAIVNNFPVASAFNPAPLSPNTYAARLRDAIKSVLTYDWKTDVDVKRLKDIRDNLTIRINKQGNVVACNGSEKLEDVGQPLNETKASGVGAITNCTEAELCAIVLLLSNRRFEGGIKITGQSSAHVNLACVGHDVEWMEEPDGSIILI